MWSLIFLAVLLPVWRYPPYEGGFNVVQLLSISKQKREHITSAEAIEEARNAYERGYFDAPAAR
jgi:hypothetical protein